MSLRVTGNGIVVYSCIQIHIGRVRNVIIPSASTNTIHDAAL